MLEPGRPPLRPPSRAFRFRRYPHPLHGQNSSDVALIPVLRPQAGRGSMSGSQSFSASDLNRNAGFMFFV